MYVLSRNYELAVFTTSTESSETKEVLEEKVKRRTTKEYVCYFEFIQMKEKAHEEKCETSYSIKRRKTKCESIAGKENGISSMC